MDALFRGASFDRENLPAAMTQFQRKSLKEMDWLDFARQRIPSRGGAVGSWSASSDPLAEVLVVRDEDFQDTIAWLNSFFSGYAPITQWCRVLSQSQAVRLAERVEIVSLGQTLGSWIGAILAECSVQAGGIQSIRDVVGSAATSCATYAAGRSAAVWQTGSRLSDIASRHDELSHALRESGRPISAHALQPVWAVLNDQIEVLKAGDRRALEPIMAVLFDISEAATKLDPAELVARIARHAEEHFGLPELGHCAIGPQHERVRALDKLGEQLISGPLSPAIDALLGLGASFIDPGSAISPELLRRYGQILPLAPIWQGAFAGAMSPLRVMTDQGGLGRLIAKSLLAADDVRGRPTCDIAYEEVIRWTTPSRSLKVDVRGMFSRTMLVELVPGVTCTFAFGRSDTTTSAVHSRIDNRLTADLRPRSPRSIGELEGMVLHLLQRVERLEADTGSAQRSLELPEVKDGRGRKGTKDKP